MFGQQPAESVLLQTRNGTNIDGTNIDVYIAISGIVILVEIGKAYLSKAVVSNEGESHRFNMNFSTPSDNIACKSLVLTFSPTILSVPESFSCHFIFHRESARVF